MITPLGTLIDPAKLVVGFQNESFLVETPDGRNCRNCREEIFMDQDGEIYLIPMGATSDGGSTPSVCWGPPINIPPFGPEWPCYYLHDGCYQGWLLKWVGGDWVPAMLNQVQSDNLLWNALTIQKIPLFRREEIVGTLQRFGAAAFAEDRAKLAQQKL
jgi:hypothetical protein